MIKGDHKRKKHALFCIIRLLGGDSNFINETNSVFYRDMSTKKYMQA